MIIKEFRQKKGFDYRNFVLYSNHINVEVKNANQTSNYNVKLEDLGFDLHYHTANKSKTPIIIFCSILLSLMCTAFILDEKHESTLVVGVFGSILLVIAIVSFLRSGTDDVYMVGGTKNLSFFRDVPNEQSVKEFITEIKKTQKQFFKAKYITYNSRTSIEEYEVRLQWLKDGEIISEDEYGQLLHNFEISKLLE